MKEVVDKSLELNTMIKDSIEYKKYLSTKQKLYEDLELCNQLKQFRRRNYELQLKGGDNLYDEINGLVKEYDLLIHDSVVSDYLRAEQRICKVMREIYTSLSSGIEFDFLDE